MFSQTQEYGLRAVLYLAGRRGDEGPVGNQRIAEATAVPPSYLAKILQSLAESDILTSRRGVRGGFQLVRDPKELTVLEVIQAIEPLRRIAKCPLGLKTHGSHLCPMHARLDEALALVESALGNSTIQEILAEPGRPIPMVETPAKSRRRS